MQVEQLAGRDLAGPDRGDLVGTSFNEVGGDNYIFRYTGYLTDTFTASALYGTSKYSRSRRLRPGSR